MHGMHSVYTCMYANHFVHCMLCCLRSVLVRFVHESELTQSRVTWDLGTPRTGDHLEM